MIRVASTGFWVKWLPSGSSILYYGIHRNWTFHHSGAWLPALARFLSVFAIAYLANLGAVLVLIDEFGTNAYAAHAFGIAPYTALFYLGSKYFAFPEAALES